MRDFTQDQEKIVSPRIGHKILTSGYIKNEEYFRQTSDEIYNEDLLGELNQGL